MKRYFLCKGQKMGYENMVETKMENVSVPCIVYLLVRNGLLLGLLSWAAEIIKDVFPNRVTYTTFIICGMVAFAFLIYMGIKMLVVNCRYASKEYEEVIKHYEIMCGKDKNYKDCVTEVQLIDGWYMLLERKRCRRIPDNKK